MKTKLRVARLASVRSMDIVVHPPDRAAPALARPASLQSLPPAIDEELLSEAASPPHVHNEVHAPPTQAPPPGSPDWWLERFKLIERYFSVRRRSPPS